MKTFSALFLLACLAFTVVATIDLALTEGWVSALAGLVLMTLFSLIATGFLVWIGDLLTAVRRLLQGRH